MIDTRKIYVQSGQLQTIVLADSPLDAIRIALDRFDHDIVLDPNFFYLDERGHRTDASAAYIIPIEVGLAETGYDGPGDGLPI